MTYAQPLFVRQNGEKFRVTVEAMTIRNGWYHQSNTSHRLWVITLNQEIADWVERNAPGTTYYADFMHDDHPCYFHFDFPSVEHADSFIDYLNSEWKRAPLGAKW